MQQPAIAIAPPVPTASVARTSRAMTDDGLRRGRGAHGSAGCLGGPSAHGAGAETGTGRGSAGLEAESAVARRIARTLQLVAATLAPQRRVVHAGEVICRAGQRFEQLHLLNTGFAKLVHAAADGREQVVALKFRGDWIGFDGLADGRHACDAIAMDTGELWSVRYDALLAASVQEPELLRLLHEAMSRELTRERESLLAVCTLPADARVAGFLADWAGALAERGLRTDQIALRMTRAEIGNYLGMTLETVSRALSRLARDGLIDFTERGRRDIRIPELGALVAYVQRGASPAPALLQ